MKAKLTVTVNEQTKAYALPEQGVKIGRDPGQCQLALKDPDVSSLHAFICCRNGAWMLQDLGSTNGTYVNGNKITSRPSPRPSPRRRRSRSTTPRRRR